MTIADTRPRPRFYVGAALAVVFALTTGLLLWQPDWIEALAGVDPDRGSGLAEWILVAISGTATLLLSGFSWRELARAVATRTARPVKGHA